MLAILPQERPRYGAREKDLAARLVSEHYDTLVRIARAKRRRSNLGSTYSTTDLLHEAFARLGGRDDYTSAPHFIRACILAMRHVIIDNARRKLCEKRGAGTVAIPIEDAAGWLPEFSETPEELVEIADLLAKLEEANPRWLRVVDARYFAGMTEAEAAATLGLSERTVRRDWRDARDWLAERMTAA